MNYNHLFYFHVTAQEGSIARAAKRLNVSQPTISEQLKQLESYFGNKLFDRTTGALRLNSNGRRALEYTEKIFSTGDRLRNAFKEAPIPAKIRVEVGMISSTSHSVATDRLVSLFRDTSTIVRIRHGDNQYLLHELISSGLDLLITDTLPQQAEQKGVKHRELASTELVVITSLEMAEKFEGDLDSFLHRRPFIHYTEQSSYRWEIDQYLQDRSLEPDFCAESDDSYLILKSVASDIGIGVIPRSILEDSCLADQVKVLGTLSQSPKLYVLYHDYDPTKETLRALDILTEVKEGAVEAVAAE